MFNLIEFSKTKYGRICISLLWGFGLSCLFKKVCNGRNCIVYQAPNPNLIQKNIYQMDKKCYNYIPENTYCTADAITSGSQ